MIWWNCLISQKLIIMKRHTITPLFVLMLSAMAFGQGAGLSFSVRVNDCDKEAENAKEVSADFRADQTFGSAPFTVNFTDRSTGDVVHWLWNFGDGTTDSVPDPVHTYQQEGIYTVKLSVFDADSAVSVDSRTDFIRVVGYGICDSLNYDIPGNYYLYRLPAPETGYLSGNNSRGDLAKASHFEIGEDMGMLMGGIFYFAVKTNNLATDPPIVFKAWDNDGPNDAPGTVLDSANILLSEIPVDDQGTGFYPATIPFFDEWVTIDHSFYLGYELPQTQGDTLAIFTNRIESAVVGNGWEQDADGNWRTYDDGTAGYDVDNAIFPVICQPTGIDNHILSREMIIYPVPATDRVYVSFFNQHPDRFNASVVDLSGRVVSTSREISPDSPIDVSGLTPGLYILKLETPDGVLNHKIMIE